MTGVPLALGCGYEVGRELEHGYCSQRLLLVHREGLIKWGCSKRWVPNSWLCSLRASQAKG